MCLSSLDCGSEFRTGVGSAPCSSSHLSVSNRFVPPPGPIVMLMVRIQTVFILSVNCLVLSNMQLTCLKIDALSRHLAINRLAFAELLNVRVLSYWDCREGTQLWRRSEGPMRLSYTFSYSTESFVGSLRHWRCSALLQQSSMAVLGPGAAFDPKNPLLAAFCASFMSIPLSRNCGGFQRAYRLKEMQLKVKRKCCLQGAWRAFLGR